MSRPKNIFETKKPEPIEEEKKKPDFVSREDRNYTEDLQKG